MPATTDRGALRHPRLAAHANPAPEDPEMSGEMIEFPANGRTASGYLARPDAGSGLGVVVVQEWWGLVGHIRDVVDRFADDGFVALAPDLYHGESTRSPDAAGKLMMALEMATVAKDLRGAATQLRDRDDVTSKRVGVVGFCMGGQLALFGGQEYPELFGAVVNFYGVHPSVKIEPERVKVPVLAHFATRDTMTTPEIASALVEALRDAGARIEAHHYEADHAFFNDQRPEVYSATDAELAWQRTVTFLRRELGEQR